VPRREHEIGCQKRSAAKHGHLIVRVDGERDHAMRIRVQVTADDRRGLGARLLATSCARRARVSTGQRQ
jgi:hypothetical protein